MGRVALATEFGDESAATRERAGNASGGGLPASDPVQSGVRKDGVEFGIKCEIARIGQYKFDVRMLSPRGFDHLWRAVDAHDRGAAVGDHSGQMARAAAEVDDAVSRPRREQRNQVFAVV